MTHTAPTLSTKFARRLGFLVALAAFAAMVVAPASGMAAAPVKFGSKLNPTVQPSNGSPGIQCMSGPCTMVQEEAYGRPNGGHLAPKTGTIKQIRIIAADAGSFRPQIATVKHSASTTIGDTKAKVTYTGPQLSFSGQTEANDETSKYKVETFNVNIPVKKGQQLALRGNVASMVRCSSGGHNTLIFPALAKGGAFQGATDANGCWLLMEAVIR